MVIVAFPPGEKYAVNYTTLDQYDYGQILRIQGLKLPKTVEVHFSTQETGGTSITRVGVTKDGVTDVLIPDSVLENGDTTQNYSIFAFVYVTDATSGKTEYRAKLEVKARPKPEVPGGNDNPDVFRDAVLAVRESALKAEEDAKKTTEDRKAVEHAVESVKDITEQVARVEELSRNAQEAATQTQNAAQGIITDREQINTNKEGVAQLKEDLAKHPDWNQNDESAPDYVKGRTHYEESACVDYVLNMDGTNIVGLSMPEVGETMTVKINGVESAETVKAYSNNSGSYKYIGNIDVDSLLNGGTGWVIIMLYDDKAVGFANPDTTISIEVAIIHKINEKFINFDGFVRTFNYYFKGHSLYKILYKDNGSECLLYMCNNFISPEADSILFGFMGEIGFSAVGSFSKHSCFVTGYEINNIGNININRVVLGTDTAEMEELAAGYGYTHNTNPNA